MSNFGSTVTEDYGRNLARVEQFKIPCFNLDHCSINKCLHGYKTVRITMQIHSLSQELKQGQQHKYQSASS